MAKKGSKKKSSSSSSSSQPDGQQQSNKPSRKNRHAAPPPPSGISLTTIVSVAVPLVAVLIYFSIKSIPTNVARKGKDQRPNEEEEAIRRELAKAGADAEAEAGDNSQGICRDVNDWFPQPLPISPNKVLCNMTDVHNVDQECFDKADAKFFGSLNEDIMQSAVIWCNLAMPNTWTTTMDHYMAMGGNMDPITRSGKCGSGDGSGTKGCVSRVRDTPLIPMASTQLAGSMGFASDSVMKCDPLLFRRMASIVRCPQSGGHMDYTSVDKLASTCLRLRKNPKTGHMHLNVLPDEFGKADMEKSTHKHRTYSTTIRDPIVYHYKDYQIGYPPDWKDTGVCRLWDQASRGGQDTYGFKCRQNDCIETKDESGNWCIDSDFNSYMRYAHHRWNMFTRNLAGTLEPTHDPVHTFNNAAAQHNQHYTRATAKAQNNVGVESQEYKIAVARLEQMSYFSIFERMEESVELLCFTYCYDCSKLGFEYKPKKQRDPVPDDIKNGDAATYNKLDLALYEHANKLFTQRVEWMKEAKAMGVQCDLLLSGCGLKCEE